MEAKRNTKLYILTLFLIAGLYFSLNVTAEPLFAVTTGNALVRFDSSKPGTTLSSIAITGLQTGENILAADFRPANGQLYAIGSTSRLYTVNLATGVATQVGAAAFTPVISGNDVAMSFNPAVDRIRLVSDLDQNLRIDPATGTVASTDTVIQYDAGDANTGQDPNLTCIAYTNNFSGATSTTLFGIDSTLDTLVTQGGAAGTPSPNAGTLFTRATMGITTTPRCALDISNLTGRFWSSLTSAGDLDSTLYRIDFGFSNSLTRKGKIGSGIVVRALSSPIYEANAPVVTVTSPSAVRVRTSRSSISVRGTVSDETLTTGVQYRTVVGGSASIYKDATLTGTDFRFNVALRPGRTTSIDIVATDLWGNVSTAKRIQVTRSPSR